MPETHPAGDRAVRRTIEAGVRLNKGDDFQTQLLRTQFATLMERDEARNVPRRQTFRFRPFLHDPGDDACIECALAGGASVILSRDRHFRHPALAAFGLRVMSPADYPGERRSKTIKRGGP
jgi:predicted nucleic acid-binding protein